ncbi:hypothetical protein CSOJ01_05760 [Colletotrichum sojae]|uniref:Uncharacterized protein n=1 Tax=Colletotrichum sojae TaxID=2175907 RepID=A0A8H6JER6_9PEZI|nr:hypothetical protein CSOJ01_05760 [Colletotrichum sojae]
MADSLKKGGDPRDRYNPLIKPSDEAWEKIEKQFRALLEQPTISVDKILSEYFTDHERKLFLPATEPRSLRNTQETNTKRYEALLAGRFRGHRVSLAVKFTMLYFGLPVEPVLAGLFNYVKPDFDVDDWDELREVEVQPPLHFLTAHDHRNYGLDHMKGREGTYNTIPIPKSELEEENPEVAAQLSGEYVGGHELGLRGGGCGDDDDDEDMSDMNSQTPGEDGTACHLSLRGGEGDDHDADMPDVVTYESRARGVRGPRHGTSTRPQDQQFTVSTATPVSNTSSHTAYDQEYTVSTPTPVSNRPSHLTGSPYDLATFQTGLPAPVTPVGNTRPAAPTNLKPGFPPPVRRGAGRSSSILPKGTSGNVPAGPVAQEARRPATSNADKPATLYGYQGQVTFRPSDLSTFQDAVRRLLSLKSGDRCDMSLAHLDRTSRTVIRVFEADFPLSPEHEIVQYLNKESEANPANVWFVFRKGEVAPSAWEPQQFEFSTTLTKLRRANAFGGHDVAYYKMPPRSIFFEEEVPGYALLPLKAWGTNMYMPFLATAQEVLVGRPDRPGGGHCDIRIATDALANHWFGGLEIHHMAWSAMHPFAAKGKPLDVEVRSLPKDNVVFYIPGSISTTETLKLRQCSRGDESRGQYPDALKVVNQMLNATRLPAPTASYRIWRGSDFFNSSLASPEERHKPLEWSRHINNNAKGNAELSAFITKAVDDASEPCRFFVIQPVEEDNPWTICSADETREEEFPIDINDMDSFKALVQKLYKGDTSTQYDPDKNSLLLECLLSAEEDSEEARLWDQMNFVLRPDASDAEIAFVRRLVVTRQVLVCPLEDDDLDFVKQLGKNALWGPRYGETSRFRQELGLPSVAQPTRLATTVPKAKPQTKQQSKQQSKRQTQPHSYPQSKATPTVPRREPREIHWAKQPSVFGKGIYNPSIPINAPPVEEVMRTGGNRVPMVTKNVLTVTEQRRLQEDLWTVRGMALDRLSKCPWEKCRFTFRIDEQQKLLEHLQATHVGNKCPWCDAYLFEHWTQARKEKHFKEAHADELQKMLGTTTPPTDTRRTTEPALKVDSRSHAGAKPAAPAAISTFQILERASRPVGLPRAPLPPPKANSKEGGYLFCDRCGRDHTVLSNKADREHHDRRCVPNADAAGRCDFCEVCGDVVWKTKKDKDELAPFDDYPHRCRGTSHSNKPHCTKCGFSLRKLEDKEIDTHRQHCSGFFGTLGCFCPYCQHSFVKDGVRAPVVEVEKHIAECKHKTNQGTTPFEIYGDSFRETDDTPPDPMYLGEEKVMKLAAEQRRPRGAPRYLSHPLAWHDKCGGRPVVDPPSECPVYGCREPLFGLLPTEVLGHFEVKHDGVPQKKCPLCHLSFAIPEEERENDPELGEFADREEQVAHMECHVYQLWDILAGKKVPQPPVQAPFHPFHSLWDPENETGLERRDKRCPHFERCGAMVGFMNQAQWNKHMETAHGVEDFGTLFCRDVKADVEAALQARREERMRQGRSAVPGFTHTVVEATTAEEMAAASTLTDGPVQDRPQTTGQTSLQPPPKANVQAPPQVTLQVPPQAPARLTPGFPPLQQLPSRAAVRGPPPSLPRAPQTPYLPPIARVPVSADGRSTAPEDSETDPDRMVIERTKTSTTGSRRPKTPVTPRRPDAGSGSGSGQRPSKSSGGQRSGTSSGVSKNKPSGSGVSKSKSSSSGGAQRSGNSSGASKSKSSSSGTAPSKTPTKSKAADKPTPKPKPKAAKPAPPVYVPAEDMYCSRCFRKAPRKNPKNPRKNDPDRQAQMNAHSDPNRSCRIPPREGEITYDEDGKPELPSRVGWIHKTNLIVFKDIRNDFVSRHPELAKTMCPIDGNSTRSVQHWQHDPNNESNSEVWGLPFPPEEKGEEGEDDDDDDDEESQSSGSESDGGEDGGDDARRKRRRSKMYKGPSLPRDPTYRDNGEEDDLSQADPADLEPESDTTSAGEKRKRDLDKTQERTPKRPKTAQVQEGEEEGDEAGESGQDG